MKEGANSITNGSILIPAGIVFNQKVRLRIVAKNDVSQNLSSPYIKQPNTGQFEDYSVVIKANATPPIANFWGC